MSFRQPHCILLFILAALAGMMTRSLALNGPEGFYCGRCSIWYSSVNVTSDTELTITVLGYHTGYVPNSTCPNITFNMTSDGYMILPGQADPTSCIGYLTSGNGGTLSLTYNSTSNSILLGVSEPSTDITMYPC